jgi:cobalamin biosynthesis Mg chelatase CobN
MTTDYAAYREALAQLKDLPARMAADLEQAKKAHNQATALADQAVMVADAAAADTTKAVEAQLAVARSALEPLGKPNLIPPRTRASGGRKTAATRADVAEAQQALAVAVNQVRSTVKAQVERTEAENQRLAREAIERERLAREAAEQAAAAAARRKKLIQVSAATGAALVVLILIVIAFL